MQEDLDNDPKGGEKNNRKQTLRKTNVQIFSGRDILDKGLSYNY